MKIRQRGFTIVELLVVIVVIAILAAVVIFGYGAWRNEIAAKNVKNDLGAASTAMESARNFNEGYPSDIPSSFTTSDDVTVTYVMGDAKSYCLEGRSKVLEGRYFFINSDTKEVKEGTCAGGEGSDPDWTILVYDTTLTGCTTLAMQLPITAPTSDPNSTIDWGDGTVEPRTASLQSHTYATPGEKIVKYKGLMTTVNSNSVTTAGRGCLKEVRQWASSSTPTSISFSRSTNLERVPALPSSVTNISSMFYETKKFNQNISSWDTSNVTNMSQMFYNATAFNQPIGSWDTSKVTTLRYMFNGASLFNQPVDSWNTSNVTNMSGLFYRATNFNQPLSSWDTSKVTDMSQMFTYASNFNQPVGMWNTANVTNMDSMFYRAVVFNQPLSTWNTSKVTDMSSMFASAYAFNQQIGNWDTSKVTVVTDSYYDGTSWWSNGNGMFSDARSFNNGQACGADGGVLWSTLKVVRMAAIFYSADCFNARVNQWDTSTTTDMTGTFSWAPKFNQPLNSWNTSNVTYMDEMFAYATIYNQNLSSWNTTNVTPKPPANFALSAPAWTLPKPTW